MTHVATGVNMQIFPLNNGGDRGPGYHTLGNPTGISPIFVTLRIEIVVSFSNFFSSLSPSLNDLTIY